MAIPIIPIILIAGVAMFAGAAGKRASKKTGKRVVKVGEVTVLPGGMLESGAQVFIPLGTVDPEAEPEFGAVCGTGEEREQGVWSAYNHQGQCLVFWDSDTDVAMTYYIQQAFEQSGHSLEDACAPAPGWEGDPFAVTPEASAVWIPNQIQIDILKLALVQSYPQIPTDMLPPPEVRGPEDVGVPDYMEVVWTFAMSIFLREICGYVPVT